MSIDPGPIDRHLRAARWRRLLIASACVLPLAAAVVFVTHHALGALAAVVVAVGIKLIAAVWVARSTRAIGPHWVARRLDAGLPELDDSAALLLAPAEALTPLARLQQQRVRERLARRVTFDVREPWPIKAIAICVIVAIAVVVGTLLWQPRGARLVGDSAQASDTTPTPTATHVLDARARIAPPAYTHLPPRDSKDLDFSAEAGANVAWRLTFDNTPRAAHLEFHDRSRLDLQRDGDAWIGERAIAQATLYRVVIDDAPPLADDRLHRIDVVADRAPEVRVIEPDKTLTLLEPPRKTWTLAFEANDDYGLGEAKLQLTLAQGSGENIAFKEQIIALRGEGDARSRRYRKVLDLPALGVAEGDDVIVRMTIADNREPEANVTRSASFILRWPPPVGDASTGMEGLVQRQLPAYFRSQRQIIIDTEALLVEKSKLAHDEFMSRANAIGEDQKVLRLRYGQFLGEEAEDKAGGEHHHGGPGQSQAEARETETFGAAGDILAEFGHVHDIAEAATLLDPETKKLLRAALNEMWSAELQLRQGALSAALPFENRALGYIKQVQQSTRIYLARVGLELPAIDNARRLTGERKDLSNRASALVALDTDTTITRAWQALDGDGAVDAAALEQWVRSHEHDLPDALSLLAELDRLRADETCVDCRVRLRNLLWALLPAPATGAGLRAAPDATGRAYLDAIDAERLP